MLGDALWIISLLDSKADDDFEKRTNKNEKY